MNASSSTYALADTLASALVADCAEPGRSPAVLLVEQAVEPSRIAPFATRRDLDRRIAEALAAALVARVLARRTGEPDSGRDARATSAQRTVRHPGDTDSNGRASLEPKRC